MPTGYTCKVEDGSITTLREYAFLCARAMGACISMRDDSFDAPIPERFEPATYYADQLREARGDLAELKALTPYDCELRAASEYTDHTARRATRIEEDRVRQERHEAMIRKVEGWRPFQDGDDFKAFMLSQLRLSAGGVMTAEDRERYDPAPVLLSGEEWLRQALAAAEKDVERYAAEHQKEVERTEGRNRWIAALRASLDAPS